MGRDLAEAFPEARDVYRRADAALQPLGLDVSKVSFEGSDEDLKQTAVTQPAIVTHAVAVLEVLKAKGSTPTVAAGHSLGEYAALVAADALTLEDAVVLVRRRGLFMQEAVPEGWAPCRRSSDSRLRPSSRRARRPPRRRGSLLGGELQLSGTDRHRGEHRRRRKGRRDPQGEGRQARPSAPGLGTIPLRAHEDGGREARAVPRGGDLPPARDSGRHERGRQGDDGS